MTSKASVLEPLLRAFLQDRPRTTNEVKQFVSQFNVGRPTLSALKQALCVSIKSNGFQGQFTWELPCHKAKRETARLDSIREAILLFVRDHPNVTYDELVHGVKRCSTVVHKELRLMRSQGVLNVHKHRQRHQYTLSSSAANLTKRNNISSYLAKKGIVVSEAGIARSA